MTATTTHQQYQRRLATLREQVGASSSDHTLALGKQTSNLFRKRRQEAKARIDVRDFNHVLSIDPKKRIAEVEGMITYERLVTATLKHHLVPPVAPELKTITVGGAITGIGIESSCFKYGFVHETVLEMDILTGDGQVLTCSPTKHSDLFYAIPNSYGTLGYILRIKLPLVPAKLYVKIERTTFTDFNAYVAAMEHAALEGRKDGLYDYIDGLVFPPKTAYLNLATFVDDPPFVSDYTHMNIYYKSFAHKDVDYLTTYDYIFRYDTDWFWTTKRFGLENPLLRLLWGKQRMRSDVYYSLMRWWRRQHWLHSLLPWTQSETLIQDAEIPAAQAADFLQWFVDSIPIDQPVVVAPVMKYSKSDTWALFPTKFGQVYCNIGHYAPLKSDKPNGYYNRRWDQKILELGAKKMLYSDSSFSEEEFWSIFDKGSYDAVKKKYDPDKRLKSLYEKVVLKA